MKLRRCLLPTLALGLAAVLATPRATDGFTLLGHSLLPNQSDFRVFNNFSDPEANDNVTPDPQFPGYLGAVMAIWKGCVEWSSGPHGDGSGDPHQAVLGSGESSFDPIFNGEALGVGVIGDNVFSEIATPGGAVLGFAQGNSSGWWVRFHGDHVWSDGPGTDVVAPEVDLQGIACHEYGHALGLGHSGIPIVPTMSPTANGTGVPDRSLAPDDQAGIQAIYGLANSSGTKPTVEHVVNLPGSQLLIVGTNFRDLNNAVWFTRAVPAAGVAGGDPIKVTGLTALKNGTEILMTVPATVGPGDLWVKKNVAGQESTSAPFPFDPAAPAAGRPAVSAISPSQVPTLTTAGGATVTITGTGFLGSSALTVNGKAVGPSGQSFTGTWSVDSDTEITFTMPLTGSIGLVDVEWTTPTGAAATQLEILAPATPTLAATTAVLDQATGISFAGSAALGDVMLFDVSAFDGPTILPGVLELEIGGGNLANVKKVKQWTMGPKLWRKLDSGPVSGLPLGIDLYFEGLVLPAAQGYNTPWDSTNKLTVTVQS